MESFNSINQRYDISMFNSLERRIERELRRERRRNFLRDGVAVLGAVVFCGALWLLLPALMAP